jgi:MSHA biogenesis protein MshI
MQFFRKSAKNKQLLAICLANDGVYSASVQIQEQGMPLLSFISFHPKASHAWSAMLERLLKESPAKQSFCSLLLLPGEYQLLAVDALGVPVDEVKSAMRWRLKDLLDYPVEDATFDVLDVPGDQNAGARTHSLFAVVARNQQIAERQVLFDEAGIHLQVIDIPDMAQRNISALLEPVGRGLAMLSFDDHGGLLTVTFNGELYLSRRLENVRWSQLIQEDAEQRISIFERITLELQRSLDHFDRQHHFINTEKLILAPMGEVGESLRNYLISNLYLPVEVLNLANIIDFSHVPELSDTLLQQKYFMTIGAALRRDEAIS